MQHKVQLDGAIAVTHTMKVRFVAMDGGKSSVFDAALDDVEFGNDLQLSVNRNSSLPPAQFRLSQNYPNPFNPTTTIHFDVPQTSFVSLSIYDMLGREVRSLVKGEMEAGEHSIQWDGSGFSSGVYVYRMTADGFSQSMRLILQK